MNTVERRLVAKIGESWIGGTPGFRIQVYEKGKKRIDLEFGKTYPYYDWASLTKIVFSVTALMNLVDERKVSLSEPVVDRLMWFRSPAPEGRKRVRDLLSHSAGLTWWKPFYKSIDSTRSREERWTQLERLVASEMRRVVRKQTPFEDKAVYSDLDFFTLGSLIRLNTGCDFAEHWADLRDRLGLEHACYHVENKPVYKRSLYAPTERCAWRGKILQGEVHDENTWALGGVAPHAGLFGPIDDLSRWGLLLRHGLLGDGGRGLGGRKLARPETVRRFARRAIPRAVGDWGLGFMLPSKGKASCGRHFSLKSVGHLGFTGTSLWYDPVRDLLVTVLSNRVYPTRENKSFPQLRASLHDWVVESL